MTPLELRFPELLFTLAMPPSASHCGECLVLQGRRKSNPESSSGRASHKEQLGLIHVKKVISYGV